MDRFSAIDKLEQAGLGIYTRLWYENSIFVEE